MRESGSALSHSNVDSTLLQTRFSKERDASKALAERKKCLTKLMAEGMIPPEVLASLPSPGEIQRRATHAAAKAQSALATPAEAPH